MKRKCWVDRLGNTVNSSFLILPSFFHVVVAVFLGFLTAPSQQLNFPILFFVLISKCFALLVEKYGELTKYILFLGLVSFTITYCFPSLFHVFIGALILIIYYTYSKVVVARERFPLNILYHGFRYVLLYVLGYGVIGLGSIVSLLGIITVFTLGIAGEFLAGFNRGSSLKLTVSAIGVRNTKILIVILLFIAFILGSFILNIVFEFPLNMFSYVIPAYTPLSTILWLIVAKTIWASSEEVFNAVRRKEFFIVFLTIALILTLNQLGNITYTTLKDNGEVEINVRTFISGRSSWDVPWIIFNYINNKNFHYIVLHKNGVLELSRVRNGIRETFLKSYVTGMDPFQQHTYILKYNKTNVSIIIDNTKYFNIPRTYTKKFTIKISREIQGNPFWIAWIDVNQRETCSQC